MGAPEAEDRRESRRYRRAGRAPSTRNAGATRRTPPMQDPQTEAPVRGAPALASGQDWSGAPVRRLAGHASMRSYWRVGSPPASLVVVGMSPHAQPAPG